MLKQVAEAIDNVMLEKAACGLIASEYSIDIVPDDQKIVVYAQPIIPVKYITVSYSLRRGSAVWGREDPEVSGK